MDKKSLVEKIVEHLGAELQVYIKAAKASHAEATHEQSRAENKYDTRGLEAAYLARGQSKQAAELERAISDFQKMPLRPFGEGEGIDLGAYVELQDKGEHSSYFLGPRAGGTEVTMDGTEVTVITPQSPLGQQLLGKRQGETIKLALAGAKRVVKVLTVV
jgi:transcription elongation GreA/GreB family factor